MRAHEFIVEKAIDVDIEFDYGIPKTLNCG